MPNQLRNLTVEFVSLVDRAAVRNPSSPTEPQTFLLFKRDSGAPTPTGGDMPDTPTAEDQAAALKKAEDERDAAVARAEKAEQELATAAESGTEPKEPAEPAAVDKSDLPPAARAALEKAEGLAKAADERAEKAEKLAKAERDARVEREFITKAENEFPHLGKADELGPRLMRMSETLSKDDFDAHLAELKTANARIDTGRLFDEIGKSGDPAPAGAGTAELDSITRKAEDIRKADPSVSQYEATQRAMREDREAQARYLAGQR